MNGGIFFSVLIYRKFYFFFFQIRVEAYDQGVPPLSADLDLTIYVRNVNDYEPQFLIDEISVNFTGKLDG